MAGTTPRGAPRATGLGRRSPLVCAAVPTLLRSTGSAALAVAALTTTLIFWPAPSGAGASPAAGTIPALTYLHVVTPASGGDLTPYLADAGGREVLLHGAAAVGM